MSVAGQVCLLEEERSAQSGSRLDGVMGKKLISPVIVTRVSAAFGGRQVSPPQLADTAHLGDVSVRLECGPIPAPPLRTARSPNMVRKSLRPVLVCLLLTASLWSPLENLWQTIVRVVTQTACEKGSAIDPNGGCGH
jgi:hypothetical protein